ncbi:MAG: DUF6220 domain-containing protein [Candidatus Limnocylindria bacterium]
MSASDLVPRTARVAYAALAWVFVACLVIQLFLVGLDIFEVTPDSELHRDFAYLYGWLAPLLVLLAVAGKLPAGRQALTVALLVLFALQTYLPTLAPEAPLLAATHAVNALALWWLAVVLAMASRSELVSLTTNGGQ